MPRLVLTLALLLAAAPASSREDVFPAEGDRWLLDLQIPSGAGQARFARIVGEPDKRGGWATVVRCGTVDLRTGWEHVAYRADGVAYRGRAGYFGGTYMPVGGGPTGGFTAANQRGLDVDLVVPAPCPSGRAALSSGD